MILYFTILNANILKKIRYDVFYTCCCVLISKYHPKERIVLPFLSKMNFRSKLNTKEHFLVNELFRSSSFVRRVPSKLSMSRT